MVFKKILKIFVWFALCLMIGFLLLFINLPAIMEAQIAKRLPQFINPEDIEFKIQNLGFSNIHISKIHLFKSISVDSINIDYNLQSLLSSFSSKNSKADIKSGVKIGIEQVTISGLNLHADIIKSQDGEREIKIKGLDFVQTSDNRSNRDKLLFLPYLPETVIIKNSKLIVHAPDEILDDKLLIPFDVMISMSVHDRQIDAKIKLYPFGETVTGVVTYDIDKGIKAVKIQGSSFDSGHLNQLISKQTDRLQIRGLVDFNIESSSPAKEWKLDVSNIGLIKPLEAEIKDINAKIFINNRKIVLKGFMDISTPLLPATSLQYGVSIDLKNGNSFVFNLASRQTDDFKIEYNSNTIAVKQPVLTAYLKGTPEKNRGKIHINLKNVTIQNKRDNIAVNDLKIVSRIVVNLTENSSQINSKFAIDTDNITMHSDFMDSTFPKADISGTFFWDSRYSPACSVIFKAENGKVTAPKFKLKVSNINIKIPVSYPEPDRVAKGEYSIASILYDNKYDFYTNGKIIQTDFDKFNINGDVKFKLFSNVINQFNSVVELDTQGVKASLEFKTNSFQLNESDIKKLGLKDIPNAQFDVTTVIKGRADFADHNITSSLQLGINRGNLLMPDNNLTIQGINTSIKFNDFLSLNSVPGQILTIDSIEMNEIKLSNAKVRFSLEQGKSLLVENIKFNWCNGLVSSEAIRFPHENSKYLMTLYCDRLEMTQLLKQMGVFDAQGAGTLNGRIPVVYSNGNIAFDNGFLFSTPGSGGIVKINNTDKLTSGIPMNTAQFSQLDLAKEALKDFNYKWAKLKFHTKKDTLFVNMELDGEPSNMLPFEYSKEFGGFIRVDASSPGSHFQGIKLDVNLKLPFNEVLKSGNKLKSIFD